jgi:hypothetical protein
MSELEILKAARAKLEDDDYWNKNAADLAAFVGCGDIAHHPEATGEYARNLFRKRFDVAIAAEDMLQQKLTIVPLLAEADHVE